MTGTHIASYERYDLSVSTLPRFLRPRSCGPSGCVIHSSNALDTERWNESTADTPGNPAPADALIARDGTQYLYTPDGFYLVHLGVSELPAGYLPSDATSNELLLGITLEQRDAYAPTFEQYDSLADMQIYFAWRYKMRWPFVTFGHYAVARPLGRALDPYNFDWGQWLERLYIRSAQLRLPGT